MNEFQEGLADTPARTFAEQHVEMLRQQGGLFVEAVRVTRMPMLVTDPTLPGNPITFANAAFMNLSGYSMDELLGQDPHFMNGPGTDPEAVAQYQAAMEEGRDVNLELLQYRKDGTSFRAMLFAIPFERRAGPCNQPFPVIPRHHPATHSRGARALSRLGTGRARCGEDPGAGSCKRGLGESGRGARDAAGRSEPSG
jgi:PAS domain S-box-containing protein